MRKPASRSFWMVGNTESGESFQSLITPLRIFNYKEFNTHCLYTKHAIAYSFGLGSFKWKDKQSLNWRNFKYTIILASSLYESFAWWYCIGMLGGEIFNINAVHIKPSTFVWSSRGIATNPTCHIKAEILNLG